MTRSVRALIILSLLLEPGGAFAQPVLSPRQQADSQRALMKWNASLAQIRETLERGDWKAGERQAKSLVDDMAERIGFGAEQHLALAVAFKAVAEAGLGKEEDAHWDWRTAKNLEPAVSQMVNLSVFGEAGRLLAEARPRPTEEPTDAEGAPRKIVRGDTRLAPPVLQKQVKPRYTAGTRAFNQEALVIVEVIVNEEGRLQSPRVLKSGGTGLTFAALEALRGWRFEAATFDGKPIKVFYTLTVNFCVKDCDELPAETPGPGG